MRSATSWRTRLSPAVLIDIQRAPLLTKLFALSYDFVVQDLLFETELIEWRGTEFLKLGLQAAELEPHEILQATTLKRAKAALSTPDVFALCLAAGRGQTPLTGDGARRKEAKRQEFSMNGVLWLFDELERHEACEVDVLRAGLETLRDHHHRRRLPADKIESRLNRYLVD